VLVSELLQKYAYLIDNYFCPFVIAVNFAFAFALTFSLKKVKVTKFKQTNKLSKDPDPGHLGPDFGP
jgi:hypothetical protein